MITYPPNTGEMNMEKENYNIRQAIRYLANEIQQLRQIVLPLDNFNISEKTEELLKHE